MAVLRISDVNKLQFIGVLWIKLRVTDTKAEKTIKCFHDRATLVTSKMSLPTATIPNPR